VARPRKLHVKRDRNGKSRGEPLQIHPETLAVRERQLTEDGIVLEFKRVEGHREVVKHTAEDSKAGTTLGRLLLRRQQGDFACSISQEQFDAGDAWAALCRRHASIMGYSLGPHAASFEIGGGRSTHEPLEETVLYVRRKWSDCYNLLMYACQQHGLGVRNVTFGVCIENWPISALYQNFGIADLRIGLNAIARALDIGRQIR
jgi:hypothetical protein